MTFYMALDLETTGLDEANAGINEIGLILYSGRNKVADLNIKPTVSDCSYSLGALRVNNYVGGIRHDIDSDLIIKKEILNWFRLEVFPRIGNKKVKILGHNVAFDVKHLKAYLEKLSIIGWTDIFDYSVVDTSTIGQFLRDCGIIQIEKMSLGDLAVVLGIAIEESKLHTATYDAELSMKCYWKMRDLMTNLNRKSKLEE